MLLTIHRSPFCANENTTLQISTIVTDMLLQPLEERSVETAAQEINQLYIEWSQKLDTRDGKSFAWLVWTEVCFIARQIPYGCPAQERLVKFIAAMRDVPNDADNNWRELNYFGWAARDALNDIELGSQEEVNLFSFTAKLTRDCIQDFSVWAIWSFRDILEDEPSATAPAWWRAQAYQKAAPTLDARLPVPALWIDIIGEKLFRNDNYYGSAAKGVGMWKMKKAGFCLERWMLWKRRFEEISVFEHVAERTREIARGACEKMRNIEGANRDVVEREEGFKEWLVDVDPSAFGSWAYDSEAGRKRGSTRRN